MSANASSPKNIIGVFDSGLGGLTVLKYLLRDLPDYDYIYLGDNARVPYGEKSPATIYNHSREAVDWLFRQGCNLIVVACNTVSAQALRRLQQEYLPDNYPDRRLLGVIRPLAEAVATGRPGTVGIIGTKATINSGAYAAEINKLNPKIKVVAQNAPLLVPLIEEGWAKKPETKMILKKYLRPLKAGQVDTLILACTHYPFLYKEIKAIMGKHVAVPQPGEIIAASLKNYLSQHPELGLKTVSGPTRKFYTTDNPDSFRRAGERFLGQKIGDLTRVDLNADKRKTE